MAVLQYSHTTGGNILSSLDKCIATFLVSRIPSWVKPHYVVLLTVIWSVVAVIGGYMAKLDNIQWLWLMSVVIIAQYITDIVDVHLAEQREKNVARWTYYMNQLLGFLFFSSIMIGYSFLTPHAYKYLIIYTFAMVGALMMNSCLDFNCSKKIRLAYYGIGPTEGRMILLTINTMLIILGQVYFVSILPYFFLFSLVGLVVVVYRTQRAIWEADVGSKQHLVRREKKTIILGCIITIVLVLGVMSLYSHLTNPFHFATVFQAPYVVTKKNNDLILDRQYDLRARSNLFYKGFGYYKSGFHIVVANVFREKAATGSSVDEVVESIYKERLNPQYPFLISGGHFSVLYPRNLGVFYYPTLDPYAAMDQDEWEDKQSMYLKTAALALEGYKQCGRDYTTIVPTGSRSVVCIDIYNRASDGLYGLLFALDVLQSYDPLIETYHPKNNEPLPYSLQTAPAAKGFLVANKSYLRDIFVSYFDYAYNPDTGLVYTDRYLSSAKDASLRQSSFYDNVIMWKTMQLADKLDIVSYSQEELDSLKARILERFWHEEGGFFIEDLSHDSVTNHYYSSDWLAVLYTGFLDPFDPQEREYLTRSVAYIQEEQIDEPFPIKYQQDNRNHRDALFVRVFASSYGGSAIWSFWGMEYIKLLTLLAQATDNPLYLLQARDEIAAYRHNILKYQGFPEVYDSSGDMMNELFYDSVRNTGWVVNYQQAEYMIDATAL